MRKIVFTIILIYNLIGLISILGVYPRDLFYWDDSELLLLFTFPIVFFSFVYRYATSEPIYPVFIIQFVVTVICLFIGDLIVRNIQKKRK